MRNFTFIIAFVAFANFLFGQTKEMKQQSLSTLQKTEKSIDKTINSVRDDIWSEDFDGGLPDGWTIVDLSDENMPWAWGTGPVIGCYTDVQPEDIASTTPENGFMWICPDGFNSVPQYTYLDDGAVVSPNLVTMDSYFESGPIDLSAASGAVLEFYQWVRVYLDFSSEIWVSSDYDPAHPENAHWSVWQTHELPAENLDVEEFHQINITEVAAGESEVYIRVYGYGATHYYWIVDDMRIIEPFANNMLVNNSWLFYDWFEVAPEEAPSAYSEYLQHGGSYYKIPLDQVQPFVGTKIATENFGVNDQTNVVMNTEIYHKDDSAATDSSLVYTHLSDAFNYSAFYFDTITDIFPDGGYTPDVWGHYEVYLTVQMDNADDYPVDNIAHFDFEVGDSTYSRSTDNINSTAATALIITGGVDGDGLGQYYRLLQDLTVVEKFRFYFSARNRDFEDLITGGNFTAVAKLFAWNDDEEEWHTAPLVTSDVFIATMADTGTWITLDYFQDGSNEYLPAGDYCILLETYTSVDQGPNQDVYFWIGCDNDIKQPDFTQHNWLSGEWGWTRSNNYAFNLIHEAEDWDTSVSVNDPSKIYEEALQLAQNFPNPAINKTEVKYVISNSDEVTFSIYDLTGKLMLNIKEGIKPAGRHSILPDISNLTSGVYYYTLRAGQNESTRKMVIMK